VRVNVWEIAANPFAEFGATNIGIVQSAGLLPIDLSP
jgi:hypothetical protein